MFGTTIEIDCDHVPLPPPHLHSDFEAYEHQGSGQCVIEPSKLTVIRPRPMIGSRYSSGKRMIQRCIGKPVITAHVHDFFMSNPSKVPRRLRGFMILSLGTLFLGYKGTFYCKCFYFIGNEIQEDMILIDGEVEDTSWEGYQTIGILKGMPTFRKLR